MMRAEVNDPKIPPLELTWLFSRSEIPILGESQNVYAKLDIQYNQPNEAFNTSQSSLHRS